ncbi:MAG TPA: T9SS type A sorting domain-containing protein [Bacteroidetes bacterium]|nr:T9SS type A sorting domain-containing protein [Bacteroidota bacterium]
MGKLYQHLFKNNLFLLFALFLFIPFGEVRSQIYTQTFNTSSPPSLPNGWAATAGNIGTPSESIRTQNPGSIPSDYAGASGGIHLFLPNCQDVGAATVTLFTDESGAAIASTGLADITVFFGRRRTNAFNVPVAFDWSSNNGASWNSISLDVAGGASTSWDFINFSLPASANNQASLWFRWSYTATGAFSCTSGTPNFRIDDFSILGSPLPVELSQFKGQSGDNIVQLNWTTQSETNNSHFEIGHSADGRNFRKVGEIDGSGFSSEANDYFFIHKNPVKGTNYYRLKQIDFDGTFSYSKTISVDFGKEDRLVVFPNPAIDQLTIRLPETEFFSRVTIHDLSGKLMGEHMLPPDTQAHRLDVSELIPGLYLSRITTGSNVKTVRFVKL